VPNYNLTVTVLGRDKASGIFGGVSRSLGRIGEIIAGILGARLIIGLIDRLSDLAGAALDAAAQFQQMQVGLEGLVARELSRATDGVKSIAEVFPVARDRAAELMEVLSKISIISPFQVEDIQQVFRMQMAFGFTTDQALRMTDGLLNMAAGIGASSEMLQRMGYNLAQINLQGKVTALDIRQLALAGLGLTDVLRYVGKQMGLNIETHLDFNKAIAAGKITWEDFAINFQKYAEENFAGASERMARTLVGLKSTWHDVWVLTIPKLLGPAVDVVTQRLSKLLDAFLEVRESGGLELFGERFARSLERALTPLDAVLDLTTKWVGLQIDLQKVDTPREIHNIRNQLRHLLPTGDLLGKIFTTLWGEKGLSALTSFRKGLDIVKNVLDAMKRIGGALKEAFQDAFQGLLKFWDEFGPRISTALGNIVTKLLGLTNVKGGDILDIITSAGERFSEWITGEGGRAVVRFFEESLPNALDAVARFWEEHVQPAWNNVVSFVNEDLIPAWNNIKLFWDENGDTIHGYVMDFVNGLLGLTDDEISEGLDSLGQAINKATQRLVDKGPEIADDIGWILDKLLELAQFVTSETFGDTVKGLIAFGSTFWFITKLAAALAGLGAVIAFITNPITLLAGALGLLMATIAIYGQDALDTLHGLQDLLDAMKEGLLTKFAERLITNLGILSEKRSEFETIGQDWIDGLIGGLDEKWQDAIQWSLENAPFIGTFFRQLLGAESPSTVFHAIGVDLMQGFWNGMKSLWVDILAWLVGIVAEAEAKLREASQSESPSKLFRSLSQDWMTGMFLGAKDLAPKVTKALAQPLTDIQKMSIPSSVAASRVTPAYAAASERPIEFNVNIENMSSELDFEALFREMLERLRYEISVRRT
jgi:tape measure domain-containing protein